MNDSEEGRGLVAMQSMEIGVNGEDGKTPLPGVDLRWVAMISVVVLMGVISHYYSSPTAELSYECPAFVREAENFDKKSFEEEYAQEEKNITRDTTAWLQNFRNEGFDSWGHTYDEVKAGMLQFKTEFFPTNIKSGQSIYESACGIGLNLYMTLEILQDFGITDLKVYGNEYLPSSTQKANVVFDHAAPASSKKGKLCVGDSTDLSHVPSNAFDLVYTGYVSPLLDPLHFDKGDIDKNYLEYKKLCIAAMKGDNWKEQKLVILAQEKQNSFYGKWVAEMVRIAKPGSAVILEQVSYPYCEEFWDWGGVNQDWWIPSMAKYGWDVDPSSLEFMDDTLFRHRYHVFMRKNAAI